MSYDLCFDDGAIVVVNGGWVETLCEKVVYDVVAQKGMMSLEIRKISEVISFTFHPDDEDSQFATVFGSVLRLVFSCRKYQWLLTPPASTSFVISTLREAILCFCCRAIEILLSRKNVSFEAQLKIISYGECMMMFNRRWDSEEECPRKWALGVN